MGDDLTKTYSQIEIGKQIKSDIANIAKLETELQNKNLSPEEVQIKDLELKQTRANLNFLRKSNPIVESLLDNKLLRDGYINAIIAELVTDKEKYPKGYEEKKIYIEMLLCCLTKKWNYYQRVEYHLEKMKLMVVEPDIKWVLLQVA
jgi:hypothetical protein